MGDLDYTGSGTAKKRERVLASGFKSYFVTPTTKVDVRQAGSEETSFTADTWGDHTDNPQFTNKLTQGQADKGVTFHYESIASFIVTLQVTGAGKGGRNFR